MRHALTLLLPLTLATGVLAQQAGLDLEVSPAGVLAVRLGGAVVARDIRVTVVRPGWGGSIADQAGLQVTGGGAAPNGARQTIEGTLPADAGPIEFQQTIERGTEGIHITCRLRATAPIQAEMVLLRLSLPTAECAGGSWWVEEGDDLRSGPLPAELPDPYVLTGGKPAWVAWRVPTGDAGLRVDLPPGLFTAQLQDNRKFDIDLFELQLPLVGSQALDPERPLTFDYWLRPFTASDADKATAEAAARAERERVVFPSREPLRLGPLATPKEPVQQYGLLDLPLDLTATYDNPFDPAEVDVSATFAGPEGREWTVPGFLEIPYDREVRDGQERLTKAGPGQWRVRFTPIEPGQYVCRVRARDRTGEVAVSVGELEVTASEARGFIRRSERSPYYLRFDSGEPYFAVGENVCWGGGAQTVDYDTWFPKLGEAGGNYARIWLVRWNMGLEWNPSDPSNRGKFYGLGLYSPDNAARLDYVLSLAQREGIYLMLCLGYHGELLDTKSYFGEQCWDQSPYNAANGGPCATPADFWSDTRARELYKQRLRYYIARWGWSPNVLSFEFWNEVNAPAPWVAEMAAYVRSIDPYHHLLTTTYGDDAVWSLPDMDYTQTHYYGQGDVADCVSTVASHSRIYTTKFAKPYLLGEFGIDWRSSDAQYDPEGKGTNLHNGLWAALASRSMGGAAIWYWDGYVEPKGLYREFTALSRFVGDIPWPELDPELADLTTPVLPADPNAPWGEAQVTPGMGWGKATGTDYTIGPDGRLTGDGVFSTTLFSEGKPEVRMPLRFRLDCPKGGTLTLHVGQVSTAARLEVLIDGQVAWSKELTAGPPGEGEYKSSAYQADWDGWYSTYDQDYEVPLPPGPHTVEMRNAAGDWVEVTSYRFGGCVDPRFATSLEVLGISTDDFAVLWAHNVRSNWKADAAGTEPEPTPPAASFELRGLRDGSYRLEWYDTRTGLATHTEEAVSSGGTMVISPGPVARDVACKVRRAE